MARRQRGVMLGPAAWEIMLLCSAAPPAFVHENRAALIETGNTEDHLHRVADADWIAAIATVVAGKAPSEWTDADLNRFRPVLSRRVAAFQRLVALHADQRADGGGPFKPYRLTLTRPDGNEHVGLVGVDDKDHGFVSDILDMGLNELVARMGSEKRALSALMAIVAEKLLPEIEAADDMKVDFSADRMRNG